jgi:hypothetical protein
MRDYVSDEWRGILRYNHLDDFTALWDREFEWFEPPNRRRGGWSGVCRYEMPLPRGGTRGVFIKRQENHITRTPLHPLGMPTFLREMRNILRFKQHNIPALEPVYFAHRRVDGNLRAILVTEALDGYVPLETMVQQWQQSGWPKRQQRLRIMDAVADVMRAMNQHHLQHNCFYPKHIFLRFDDNGDVSVRIIDLEKVKWRLFAYAARFRDLYTLNRHSQAWSRTDRLRFFLRYLQLEHLTPAAKLFWQRIARRTLMKGRVRPPRPVGNI